MSAITLLQLPKTYYSKRNNATYDIKARKPYVMAADLVIAAAASPQIYPDGSFVHTMTLPFEVLRMIPSVAALDSNGVQIADPNIGSLLHLVQVQIQYLGDARPMTFVATRLSELLDKETQEWAFDSPLYLEQQDGFQVTVTNLVPSGSAPKIRFELGFEGSLLVF